MSIEFRRASTPELRQEVKRHKNGVTPLKWNEYPIVWLFLVIYSKSVREMAYYHSLSFFQPG